MKDKLEVGMYVRLNCNYELGIGKIIREIDEDNFIKAKFKDDFECSVPMYMILKASHNIIDLIEVGDYVNGIRVNRIEKEDNGMFITIGTITNYISKNDINPYLTGGVDGNNERLYQLETIVTKEQFESIKYSLEG